eukprot:TRINITY_DN2523_c0_g1_i2.p3 TRINITY_DN2523_c0_g1~~TRINITY_DN2523_c0_g1_i2.p3  ORF type:complete len:178 (-),score=29.41 TRINITY_DN2523_c0_g1_i2:1552-2085(-)
MNSFSRRYIGRCLVEKLHESKFSPESLWKVISTKPIFNDITIYGSYMCPSTGFLQCRIPIPGRGFKPISQEDLSDQMSDYGILVDHHLGDHFNVTTKAPYAEKCINCQMVFDPSYNKGGGCKHGGSWHHSFQDCNYIVCGIGLAPQNIGVQHWSCCFSTQKGKLTCSKSGPHQAYAL